MPGSRLASYWEGDRAEVLAQYALSMVAAVVTVPRQVDFGFDFICTLVRKAERALYAGRSFGVQVKSVSCRKVKYGGFDASGTWKKHEIDWLYGQSLPLLFCLIDQKSLTSRIYNASRIWWIRWTSENPSAIVLLPEWNPPRVLGVGLCSREPIRRTGLAAGTGDGYRYRVPLGPPIATMSLRDTYTAKDVRSLFECIDQWVAFDYMNIVRYQLGIPYSEHVVKWRTNVPLSDGGIVVECAHHKQTDTNGATRAIFHSIAPALESLIRQFGTNNRPEQVDAVLPLARLAREHGAFFWSGVDELLSRR